MGKVYEFGEIANNQVPRVSDFATAKEAVLDELSQLAFKGEVFGAKIFGSVAKGTPNERSDFDLVVITERDLALPLLKDVFEGIRCETRVDVEPLVIDREFAQRGFHSIDELFLRHIRSIPNPSNLAGIDPTEVLEPPDLPPIKVHEQYLAQKLRRLREGVFTHLEIDRNRVLQRALEAPISVGRRTLQTLSILGYPLEIEDDSKQSITRIFKETFNETDLLSGFMYLGKQDRSYTDYLMEALQGRIGQREYEARLRLLSQACIPSAIDWVSKISLFYSDLLVRSSTLLK